MQPPAGAKVGERVMAEGEAQLDQVLTTLRLTFRHQTGPDFSLDFLCLLRAPCISIFQFFPMQYLAAFHLLLSRLVRLGYAGTRRQAQ